MSLDLFVYLRDTRLPTRNTWQKAIDAEGVNLTLDDFKTREFDGFLPCRLDGVECGFEYYFGPLHEDEEGLPAEVSECDRVVTFTLATQMRDLQAAMYAAAALTELTGGVFHDPQTGESAKARGVYDLIRRDQEAERTRSRAVAAKDAAITNKRCPHCGAPCPSYRRTCKVCDRQVR